MSDDDANDEGGIDWRDLLRHITPMAVLQWTLVITAWCLAIIGVLWVAAQAWQSS